MDFHKKLKLFFEKKGLNNKELGKILGYSDVMVSRYLNSNKPNYDFLMAVKKNFPDVDLNPLFEEEENNVVKEDRNHYQSNEEIIDSIEYKLKELRVRLAQTSHK